MLCREVWFPSLTPLMARVCHVPPSGGSSCFSAASPALFSGFLHVLCFCILKIGSWESHRWVSFGGSLRLRVRSTRRPPWWFWSKVPGPPPPPAFLIYFVLFPVPVWVVFVLCVVVLVFLLNKPCWVCSLFLVFVFFIFRILLLLGIIWCSWVLLPD